MYNILIIYKRKGKQKEMVLIQSRSKLEGASKYGSCQACGKGTDEVKVKKITFADEGVSDSYGVLLDDVKVEARQDPNPVPEFPTAFVPVTFVAGILALVLFVRIKTE